MANITIRIDDDIKKQLQELMTELGLDITTYFTMAAKQAIREQGIPFEVKANNSITGGNKTMKVTLKTMYEQIGEMIEKYGDVEVTGVGRYTPNDYNDKRQFILVVKTDAGEKDLFINKE